MTEFARQSNASALYAEPSTVWPHTGDNQRKKPPRLWGVVVQKKTQVLDMLLLPAAKLALS